jgi:spermidine synthase
MQNQGFTFPIPKSLYFLIFTISGFSGLIYESIWSHYLKLFLGHAAYAQSLVLSIFMGGMAVGAWLAGNYSSRWRTPILAYAIIEGIVGVFALIFHGSFVAITDGVYLSLIPGIESSTLAHLAKWSIASLMIVPQSILLGMTFPLMTAGVLRRYPEKSGASISLLYFTNSIGGAIGVLASGFWLIKTVGLPGTIMTAGLINILLGLVVWILLKLDTAPVTAPLQTKTGSANASSNQLLLAAAFITGMASFIYEIGWIRMLSLVLGSSTHAFELMLSAFITGLALGGLWIRKRIDSIGSPVRFAAYVQIIMGLFALLTLPLYSLTFDWMSALLKALSRTDEGYTLLLFASHAIVLIIMLPATFCAGMTLPLFTHALLKSGYGEKSIGRIYAFNTLGSIIGVVFAVNIGLSYMGLKYLITFGGALDIILGVVLLYFIADAKTRLRPVWTTSVIAGLLGLLILSMADISPSRLASGVFRYVRSDLPEDQRIYFYRDGKTASITVYGDQGSTLTVLTNGKPDATLHYEPHSPSMDESTMVLSGALPFGFKPDARLIANIGMGSGLTAHTVLALPQVQQLDSIEIEPAMVEASKKFGHRVARAHTDPRSKIHIEDAKIYFSINNKQYDIIISEPSNPWVSGTSSLFTDEFYHQIKRYIVEDGLMVQWIHLYENNMNLLTSVLKAIDKNFGDYALYLTNHLDVLIIARKTGLVGNIDADFLINSEFKTELKRINVLTVSDLHHRLLLSKANMTGILRESGVPVNSDYFPYLDLNAHKAFYMGQTINTLYKNPHDFPSMDFIANDPDSTPVKNLTASATYSPSITFETARIILNSLINPDKDPEKFGRLAADVQNEILSLREASRHCDREPHGSSFLKNLHTLAQLLIANLDWREAALLFSSPPVANCGKIAGTELSHWLRYYKSLTSTDYAAISQTAEELLPKTRQPRLFGYVLTSAIVGNYKNGKPEAATRLWEKYKGVYSQPDEMPFSLRIAVHTAHDPAAIAAGEEAYRIKVKVIK